MQNSEGDFVQKKCNAFNVITDIGLFPMPHFGI